MKKFGFGFLIINIACVLLFSMPSYAQVETQRFLTPGRTSWLFLQEEYECEYKLGFLHGNMWLCVCGGCMPFDEASYKNRLISRYDASMCNEIFGFPPTRICERVSGYTVPLFEFGKVNYCISIDDGEEQCHDWVMEKVSDNFTP